MSHTILTLKSYHYIRYLQKLGSAWRQCKLSNKNVHILSILYKNEIERNQI